jgi:hypothetical protein
MTKNQIELEDWSEKVSLNLFLERWKGNEITQDLYKRGYQCVNCYGYRQFNDDWGLCVNPKSFHFKETIFEHFTCETHLLGVYERKS